MSRYPFGGVELRGQAHPQNFWLSKISGEIPENSSRNTFVSYWVIN